MLPRCLCSADARPGASGTDCRYSPRVIGLASHHGGERQTEMESWYGVWSSPISKIQFRFLPSVPVYFRPYLPTAKHVLFSRTGYCQRLRGGRLLGKCESPESAEQGRHASIGKERNKSNKATLPVGSTKMFGWMYLLFVKSSTASRYRVRAFGCRHVFSILFTLKRDFVRSLGMTFSSGACCLP